MCTSAIQRHYKEDKNVYLVACEIKRHSLPTPYKGPIARSIFLEIFERIREGKKNRQKEEKEEEEREEVTIEKTQMGMDRVKRMGEKGDETGGEEGGGQKENKRDVWRGAFFFWTAVEQPPCDYSGRGGIYE